MFVLVFWVFGIISRFLLLAMTFWTSANDSLHYFASDTPIETATRRPPHPWRETKLYIEINILRVELFISNLELRHWRQADQKLEGEFGRCWSIWVVEIDQKSILHRFWKSKWDPKATKLHPKPPISSQSTPKAFPNQPRAPQDPKSCPKRVQNSCK